MTDDADAGLDGLWTEDGGLEAPRGPRIGAIVGGFLALAASAVLAWWAANPERSAAPPAPAVPAHASAPVQPLRYASDEPDPAQVKQAYTEVQKAFTERGGPALVEISLSCAQKTPADPRRLDYCLAFDVYAAEIVHGAPDAADQADWFEQAPDRDLALARSVLPEDVDAANRLAQVRALTVAVLPKPKPTPAKARPVRARRHHAVKAKVKAKPKPAHLRKAHAVRPKPAHRAAATSVSDEPRIPAGAAGVVPPGPWDDEVPPH